jgi:site-specific DNA recombinase
VIYSIGRSDTDGNRQKNKGMQGQDDTKVDDNIAALLKRSSEIDKQINRLMDLYQLDNIPFKDISDRIEKLHNEKKLIEKETKKEPLREVISIDDIFAILHDFDNIWDELEPPEKKEITSRLIDNEIKVFTYGV